MVLLDYIRPVESISVGFIIIGPLPDEPQMPHLGSIHPMATWDNSGAKIVVTPCHMTVRGNIPLANSKTYY